MKKKDKIITNNQDNKIEGTYETDLASVKNPHDNLFIRIFTRKEKAIAFLKKYLSAALLAIIDLDSIEYLDSKHTPELGINLYNDLILQFSLKNKPGLVSICFEHQSTIDLEMPFRFLSYIVAMIKKHREKGYKTIPILPNVLFYTGSSPWQASTKFDDYYDDPAIGSKYLHLEEFTLIKLPADREHPDYVDKDLGYCMVAFKCGREGKNAYEEFKKFIQIPAFSDYFDNLPEEERLLAAIYIGLFVSDSMADLKKIVTLIAKNKQENEKFMRTIAQRFQEEGIQAGILKGRQEGKLEIAKNMLFKLKLGVDAVQKATDLSKEVIQNLLKDVKTDRKK